MKIKSLHINSHYQLENLDFDFTYPKGHKKAGQPLEKICFIGQSATGKTNLLKLISETVLYILRLEIVNGIDVWNAKSGYSNDLNGKIELVVDGNILKLEKDRVEFFDKTYKNRKHSGGPISQLVHNLRNENKVVYFDANYISSENIKYFNTKPLEIVFEKREDDYNNLDEFLFKENISDIYIIKLLQSFLDYRQKFDTKARELLLNGYISDINKLNNEFQKWQKENPNPIDDFSEKFNLLLNKLNLEIDKINVDYPIPFKIKNKEEIIPVDKLSTGTKALLLYMLPLYQINTSKSIILIDEPERSLYPDVQMELLDFFQSVSPDAQFIIATHSPFIAASFEPEERFILSFDKDGNVKVNRGTSPIGDDPNDILYNDFGINYINEYGQKAFDEYKKLKEKIHFEKNEKKKMEYSEKLEELGEKYNF